MQNPLRNLPAVNELLETPPLAELTQQLGRSLIVSGIRSYLDRLRHKAKANNEFVLPNGSELSERIADWIRKEDRPSLRPVINATGILLHTGLGRAPLAMEAVEAITSVASGYASLEVDLESGNRSQRVRAVERLLRELTGAEAAVVVNNNAAATFLVLKALADGREVIVSRGQLIEIGGSFRLPDVMAASGATLREVGTTNKTRISDYAKAINENTAALMRVHTSNYVVMGFTEEASLDELVALGAERQLPVIDDIGSGALIPLDRHGVSGEPVARDCVRKGADVVLFSGDKLLGGPQCGIIVGRKPLMQKIAKHPMMRALRVDKITLAALAATLRLYRDEETARRSIPLLSMLNTPASELQARAQQLAAQLVKATAVAKAEAIQDVCYLGGGSVPTQQISTWCVALKPSSMSVDAFAESLRMGEPSVFGRVQQERLLLDLRSVAPAQDALIARAVTQLGV